MNANTQHPLMILLIAFIILLAIWDGVWKAVAMWKSARNSQLGWFVCMVVFNTAGVLPILYILFFQKISPLPPAARREKLEI